MEGSSEAPLTLVLPAKWEAEIRNEQPHGVTGSPKVSKASSQTLCESQIPTGWCQWLKSTQITGNSGQDLCRVQNPLLERFLKGPAFSTHRNSGNKTTSVGCVQ